MAVEIGYMLPTRERTMTNEWEAEPLLALAEKAEELGFDSVWAGDSIIARPRHEPITLLTAVAARTSRIALGTAVLVPALRNPLLLAHQIATLDLVGAGRTILGVGIGIDTPNVHAEFQAVGVPFERRIGRMVEGLRLCRALWTSDSVDWSGAWRLKGASLGIKPARPGGPPIWAAGSTAAGLNRVARHYDGWLPTGPADPTGWGAQWAVLRDEARRGGRDPDSITGAIYVTISVADTAKRAEEQLTTYLKGYYGPLAKKMRDAEACFAGTADAAAKWLGGYGAAGASHIIIRFAGDHDRQLEAFAALRDDIAA